MNTIATATEDDYFFNGNVYSAETLTAKEKQFHSSIPSQTASEECENPVGTVVGAGCNV